MDDISQKTIDVANMFLMGYSPAEVCKKLNISEAILNECLVFVIEHIGEKETNIALKKEIKVLKDTIKILNERIRALEMNGPAALSQIEKIPKGTVKVTGEQMRILQMNVEDTDLKRKLKNSMAENDIKTVKEMSEYTMAKLMGLKKVGKTLADEARLFLKSYGLKLGATYYTDNDGHLYMR